MRVFVTGGAGFLGKSLTRCLLQRGDTVVVFDTSVVGLKDLRDAAPDRLFAVTGDITDMSSIATAFKAYMPDVIVHCAAAAGAPSPMLAIRTNVEGSINVFDAMRLFGIRRCIHISSEESYGPFREAMIDEDHAQNPVTPYGIGKLTVEHLSRAYRRLHNLDVIHLRTSWVYGAGLPRNRVPKNLIEAALSGQSLHIAHGGDSAIDHTYVDDFVSAALLALDCPDHPYDAYNIGSGTSPTLYEVVKIIKESVPDADISIGAGVYRYFGQFEICRKGALDIGRARRVLGYVPRFDFRAGVREYIEQVRCEGGHV